MFSDVAVREVEMALAAFVLARMTESRSDALSSALRPERNANALVAV